MARPPIWNIDYRRHKDIQWALPPEKRNIRYSILKAEGVLEAGYKVIPEEGVVLGKRGKPLKVYVPKNGRPMVDVRTKLPFPLNKTKVYVDKMVAYAAHGPDALGPKKGFLYVDGDPANTKAKNILVTSQKLLRKRNAERSPSP